MAVVKAKELRRQLELDGAAKTYRQLSEALEQDQLRAEDFSLRDLAEQFCGAAWVLRILMRVSVRLIVDLKGLGIRRRLASSCRSPVGILAPWRHSCAPRLKKDCGNAGIHYEMVSPS